MRAREKTVDNENGNARIGALIVGAIDAGIFVSYLAGIGTEIYVVFAILSKIVIVSTSKRLMNWYHESWVNNYRFYVFVSLVSFVSELVNFVSFSAVLKVPLLMLSLSISVTFTRLRAYWAGIAIVGAVNAFLYIVFLRLGKIEDLFGRFMYFGGAHPNLAGEFFMCAAFGALFLKNRHVAMAVVLLSLYGSIQSQARSSTLSVLVCLLLIWGGFIRKHLIIAGVLTSSIAVLLLLIYNISLHELLNSILLLDSDTRGLESNGSGRTAYWATAIRVFLDNPVFGAGSGFPERLNVLQPHQFFLYPFAWYGIFGLIILGYILMYMWHAAIYAGWMRLLPFLPMLVFNDRFMNSNTYPFVFYVFIIGCSDSLSRNRMGQRYRGITVHRVERLRGRAADNLNAGSTGRSRLRPR